MGKFRSIKAFFIGLILFSQTMVFTVDTMAQQDSDKVINIGLLVSDSTKTEAKQGVELAIKEAGKKEILKGKRINLIARSMEGLWGAGATQTVDLVFNHNVWAIIGSHDGRNAHLAEQVIAKTQVVYISAWAGDPTLAQAYVPWFFSLVPNNIQQAAQLYQAIYSNQKEERIMLIADEGYDTQNALNYFLQEIDKHNETVPRVIRYKTADFNERTITKIKDYQPDVLVVFGQPSESVDLVKLCNSSLVQSKVYLTFTALGENDEHTFYFADFEEARIPNTFFMTSSKGKEFAENYLNEFDKPASPTAAYAYDAAWLVIKKINESDFDREKFKDIIRSANDTGVTGKIQFDELGRRIQSFEWILVHENLLNPDLK
ncbi:ABC transporter substrate-binding protein [Draconibacterium halophilum]|uniref:Amino acid ABC transporter substrate-binding protein n=1 Tax=Draconibacterium halophilum TaxID=2706887 RepID=A0A6C0RCE8_9BACT|nr:ABC transporter substrate-binding protein [Draconibacterium halophilum]QIA07706.1 amino acid ABC transporter substrate-binding protein [Draconibacterium halophilum]